MNLIKDPCELGFNEYDRMFWAYYSVPEYNNLYMNGAIVNGEIAKFMKLFREVMRRF